MCAQRTGQQVPVGEVGGVVVLGLEVVQIMMTCPTVQPEWHQPVGGPRQVIATVVLHRQPDVEQEEGQLGEWVAAQQEGVGSGEEAQAESLPSSRVLSGEGGGRGKGVVHLQEEKKKHEDGAETHLNFVLVTRKITEKNVETII